MVHIRSQCDHTCLHRDDRYFHGQEYNDNLVYNLDYNFNDVESLMIIANIQLKKNNVVHLRN